MPEPANNTLIHEAEQVLAYAAEQAAALRHKFGEAFMRGELPSASNIGLSPPIWVTYPTISTSLCLPDFARLHAHYMLENFELSWIMGFSLRTPGKLFQKLPMEDNLVIPLEHLKALKASVTLKPIMN